MVYLNAGGKTHSVPLYDHVPVVKVSGLGSDTHKNIVRWAMQDKKHALIASDAKQRTAAQAQCNLSQLYNVLALK